MKAFQPSLQTRAEAAEARLAARIAECEQERDRLAADLYQIGGERFAADAARLAAEGRLAEYREALKPLARISLWRDAYPDAAQDILTDQRLPFTAEEVRRARALASEGEKP